MPNHPTDAKVIAATGASAGATIVSGFIIWLLAVTVFGADWHDVNLDVVKVVPGVVISMVALVIIPGATHAFGYYTHHTERTHYTVTPQPTTYDGITVTGELGNDRPA